MNFEATAGIQARLLATDKKELDPKTAEALVAVLNKFSRVMLIGSLAAIEKALNLMEDASNLATNIEHHHKDGASKSADQLNDHIVDFLNTVRPELKISSPLFSLPD
jgi:predicted DNA-binding protein